MRRLRERRGHLTDPKLLASQLDTLKDSTDAVVVDVDADLEMVAEEVMAALGLPTS